MENLFESSARIEAAISESARSGEIVVVRSASPDEVAYAEVCGHDDCVRLIDGSLDLWGPSTEGPWRIRVVPHVQE